jgi:hypothetical protein
MIRSSSYVLVVVLVSVAALGYRERTQGVFSCSAAGYADSAYLAYCHTEAFGDYDHGAFWFDLESTAIRAAAAADVLFLGNSRMQFGFSTTSTTEWFASRSIPYYLLGFAYTETMTFVSPYLERLEPRARAYVINVDRFFNDFETPPAAEIFRTPETSYEKYRAKRRWQWLHRHLCTSVAMVCGDQAAFFRRPHDGQWRLAGHAVGDASFVPQGVSDATENNRTRWPSYIEMAKRFVSELSVDRRCVILTLVPSKETRRAEAGAIAHALGIDLVDPVVPGLRTFDGSHLDEPSAERWSAAFLEAAGSRLRACASQDGPAFQVDPS